MDDSVIICDEVIESYEEEIKTIPTNLNEKKQPLKRKISIFLYNTFLLITIVLVIAVSIYHYMIKYRAKQKHLLPFQFTNKKFKEIIY